jgi:aminoglycoside phosphotransferase (APT) family kinase protein
MDPISSRSRQPVDLVSSRMLTNDTLRYLLRDALGSGVEIASSSILNQRDEYLVLRVELRRPSQAVIVKLAGPGAQHAALFDRTAVVHQIVRSRTSVPIAEVIAVDVTYRRWPWRYLIATVVPGEEWATVRPRLDAREVAAAQRQIGDIVGQLHTIRLPTFGEIDVDAVSGLGEADAVGGCGAESGQTQAWTAALVDRARRMIGDPVLRDLFLSILAEGTDRRADVPGPALTHDDLHQRNILFRPDGERWRLSALLDFDKAWAADPGSDLGRLELWRGMTGPDFWSAYRAHRAVSDGYAQRRPLYQLLWCLEYDRATPAHLEDTRQVCAVLGLSVVVTKSIVERLGRSTA